MSITLDGKHVDITDKIIKAFYTVYNTLGYGFSEKVYENATAHEGRKLGLHVDTQKEILVYYDGVVVGQYFGDLVANGLVIAELKSVHKLLPEHEAQLLNYLKATPVEVGLLLNFGPKPEIQRKTFDNARKGRPLGQTGNRPIQTRKRNLCLSVFICVPLIDGQLAFHRRRTLSAHHR